MLDGVEGVGGVEERGVDPFDGKPAAFKDLAGSMSRMWGSFIYGLDPNLSDGLYPSWSVYANSPGRNYVLDANITSLAYGEEGIFRVEVNNYSIRNFLELFGR